MNDDGRQTAEIIEQHGSFLLISRRIPFRGSRTARRSRLPDEVRRARGRTADTGGASRRDGGRGLALRE
jgi:hypothetical protein